MELGYPATSPAMQEVMVPSLMKLILLMTDALKRSWKQWQGAPLSGCVSWLPGWVSWVLCGGWGQTLLLVLALALPPATTTFHQALPFPRDNLVKQSLLASCTGLTCFPGMLIILCAKVPEKGEGAHRWFGV